MTVIEFPEQFNETLREQREITKQRVDGLRGQAAALRSLLGLVEADLQRNEHMLQSMEELLGLAPEIPVSLLTEELRGKHLREVAIALLREKKGEGQAIHYRDWLRLVTDAGVKVGGRDPAATFLTQISSAAEVESVRPRSGMYRLKAA